MTDAAAQIAALCQGMTLDQIETIAIRAAFVRLNGNRTRMRRELGLSKSGLLRKLDRLGLREASRR